MTMGGNSKCVTSAAGREEEGWLVSPGCFILWAHSTRHVRPPRLFAYPPALA